MKAINYLFSKIPVQSCEYLFKRLYEHFDGQEDIVKTQRHSETKRLIGRLTGFDGGKIKNSKIAKILVEIYDKFGYTPKNPENIRKGSMLFYRIFDRKDKCNDECHDECNGKCEIISFKKRESAPKLTALDIKLKTEHNIELDIESERSYKIELDDKLNFLINGILFTFRNDRAHGAVFSPFRSSKASIKTYAHCNFCFLAAYILLLILLQKNDNYRISNKDVVKNINQNIDLFSKLYGNTLKE